MNQSLQRLVSRIGPLDGEARRLAQTRQDSLTKPRGSLGRLETLSLQIAGITGNPAPTLSRKAVVTMAGDHGVATEGVSAYPSEVTAQMVANFLAGGAAINVLARQVEARVIIVDMGVCTDLAGSDGLVDCRIAAGTRNIAREPAMTRAQAERAILAGAAVFEREHEGGLDIVGTGDMGIANTTPSAAIAVAMTGHSAREIVGRGTGVDDAGLARKIATVERALACNRPQRDNPLDVLAKVGGYEIAGIAGVILAAAANRCPVVVDGFISTAGALIATGLAPLAVEYIVAAHCSQELGHRLMLEHLGVTPLLDLDLRLGEGTGAALGIFLAEAACRLLTEMATFEEAAVSGKACS